MCLLSVPSATTTYVVLERSSTGGDSGGGKSGHDRRRSGYASRRVDRSMVGRAATLEVERAYRAGMINVVPRPDEKGPPLRTEPGRARYSAG